MFRQRLSFYLGGLAILTLGATLMIKAQLGTGPWDSVNVGLTERFGWTVGVWSGVIGLCLIFINAMIGRSGFEWTSVITVIVSSVFIDMWLLLVFQTVELVHMPERLVALSLGVIFISFGIGTYLHAKWPLSPVDGLMVALKERFSVSLGVAKTISEVLALTFAILLSGPVGIGTVLIAIGLGPFVTFFHEQWKKWHHQL